MFFFLCVKTLLSYYAILEIFKDHTNMGSRESMFNEQRHCEGVLICNLVEVARVAMWLNSWVIHFFGYFNNV